MRFDHEEFEADLPDDLVLLGEQLFDDAEHLGSRFPSSAKIPASVLSSVVELSAGIQPLHPNAVETLSTVGQDGSMSQDGAMGRGWACWTRRLTSAAALVLFIVGVWAFQSNTFHTPNGETAGSESSLPFADLFAGVVSSGTGEGLSGDGLSAIQSELGLPQAGPQAVSATLFESLSGPEQEALLDLLEDEGMLQASLSM